MAKYAGLPMYQLTKLMILDKLVEVDKLIDKVDEWEQKGYLTAEEAMEVVEAIKDYKDGE